MHYYTSEFNSPPQINILGDKLLAIVCFSDNGSCNTRKVIANEAQFPYSNIKVQSVTDASINMCLYL